MAKKKSALYKRVPKPGKPGKSTTVPVGHLVDCIKCGTHGFFTLKAMLDHDEYWCDLAKEEAQKQADKKLKKKNRASKRH